MEEYKRRLVISGEQLGEGRAGHNTFVENGKIHSRVVGLAEEKNGVHFVISLSGIYNPKKGDGVIGQIEEIVFSKWIVDINSPYQAVLPLSEATDEFIDLTKTELSRYFDYGDFIFAEISAVSKTKNVQLSMKSRKCRKLREGRILKVVPSKVPRIIGKSGSMVEMIKEMTGTQIVVGQNGIVWVKGENEAIAAEAVLTIEKRAHTQGLTDYIKEMINKLLAKKGPPRSEEFKMPSREEGENENDQNGNEQVGQGDEEDEFRPDV